MRPGVQGEPGGDEERKKMRRYVVRRLLFSTLSLVVISMMVFAGLRTLKGDLAVMLIGREGISAAWEKYAQPGELEAFREKLGLSDPIPIQYLKWLRLVLQGEFGQSAYTQEPAVEEIAQTLPVTLQLAAMATIIAWLLGVPIGLISALKHDTAFDNIVRVLSISGLAIPGFWIGALLITLPAVWWHWTPLKPYVPLTQNVVLSLERMFWPALTLAFGMAAGLMRLTRAMSLEVLQCDYIRTARAKGLGQRTVVLVHTLKNAMIPVLCQGGIQFGTLIGGTVIIEELFMLPGLGRLLVQSIFLRDYAVVQAAVLYLTVGVTLVNLLVDVSYAWVDPRIRYT
jgi:peptide/nickel transport system permease protein